MFNRSILVCSAVTLALFACKKKEAQEQPAAPAKEPPPIAVVEKNLPPTDELAKAAGLEFVGEPIKQAADFPKERWVRTVLFDQKTPYIGFTYVDKSKGNSIKGEKVEGLSPAQIKELLHADFPSSTMQPIPEGHPMTPLTDAEIKELDLPAQPEWYEFYK